MSTTSIPSSTDVAVLGGGLIGLSIAWRLAEAGKRVCVVERGEAGKGASWAAAGMLAAGAETGPEEADLYHLLSLSQTLWPRFAKEVEAASGVDVGLRQDGTLVVALDDADEARLKAQVETLTGMAIPVRPMDGAGLRAREGALSPETRFGFHSPLDGQVDNRALGEALLKAAKAAGAIILEHAGDAGVLVEAGRAVGLRVGETRLEAEHVVLATGPWAALSEGLPESARPPVFPVKGQMAALQSDPGLLSHVVWGPGIYLVPRADGRVILGATVEHAGFDPRLTAGGIQHLLSRAIATVPALADADLVETWSGFRPGSPDGLPLIGPGALPGLTIATGHYRNGVLLTPITAVLVAHSLLGIALPCDLAPYDPSRFLRPAPGLKAGSA